MIDRTNRYYLTTAEMLVMRAIWLADHDMVLSEVVKACNAVYEKNWKPQTVSTYLSHLVQKEFLRMDRNGKIYSYHPIVESQKPGGQQKLQDAVIKETINPMINEMCKSAKFPKNRIYRMCVASNTTMNHLFAGINSDPLRTEPYIPAFFIVQFMYAFVVR